MLPATAATTDHESGQRAVNAALLLELKRRGVASTTTLTDAVGCSVNTVRGHLRELERNGLVEHDLLRQGVGAPAFGYRLSDRGHQLFPDHGADVLTLLLDELVSIKGREASAELLRSHFASLGERLCREVEGVPSQGRAARITAMLDDEGFMPVWEAASQGGVLTEHNCPHRLVAERFPEVCAAEEAFLAQAFGATVRRESRIAAGCGCCRYHITPNDPAEEGDPA